MSVKSKPPAIGVDPVPDVSLTALEELLALVEEEADREEARLSRDLRLARSVHTFYGPAAARPPERLTQAAFRKFGERVRIV
jgi:hypothetical protein